MISDVPGYTWGSISAMAQAGIRYFSPAPNWFDRIGRLMVDWQDKPFWHISPSGKEKVLVWIPWSGYAFSHVQHEMSGELVAKYQDRLDSINFPYDISYERWSGHGDNAEPDPQIKRVHQGLEPGVRVAEVHHLVNEPGVCGIREEIRQCYSEIQGRPHPLLGRWRRYLPRSRRESTATRPIVLTQAEALAAMYAPRSGRTADFNEAWRNVLLYSEHTWGAGRQRQQS